MPRLCVIDCENSNAWKPISMGDMFTELLRGPEDEWETINIARGETMPDGKLYDGCVITGSHFNCRDEASLPWFEALCNLIKEAYETGKPRIYGGCFGCQIIACALGGKVDHNPGNKFFLKAETIIPVDTSALISCCNVETVPSSLKVIVSHGDCVEELPSTAILLATSSSCTNELFVVGKGPQMNILACQSHPEFDYEYAVVQRIWPAVCVQKKRLTEEAMTESEATFREYSRDAGADFLIEAIKSFLHS